MMALVVTMIALQSLSQAGWSERAACLWGKWRAALGSAPRETTRAPSAAQPARVESALALPQGVLSLARHFEIPEADATSVQQVAAILWGKGWRQRALWTLRRFGHSRQADSLERKLVEEIREANAFRHGSFQLDGSTHPSLLVIGEGVHGVFKIGRDADREIAAYLLDKEFGLNRVPLTIRLSSSDSRIGSLEAGSFQLYLDKTERLHERYQSAGSKPRPDRNLLFFDYLIGNIDRVWMRRLPDGTPTVDFNYKNVLLAQPDDYQVAIDHANAFGKPAKPQAQLLGDEADLDDVDFRSSRYDRWFLPTPEFLERVASVDRERLRQVLSPYLTPKEIEELFGRMSKGIRLAREAHAAGTPMD